MHNTFDHCGLPSNQWTHTKGAFIIYLEGGGGAMMILRGVTLFAFYYLGGAVVN